MKLSDDEKLLLKYLEKEEIKIIPEDLTHRFTPETLQFTLARLQAKGLVEYMEGAYMPTEKAQKLFKKKERIREELTARGHPRITAKDEGTIKITKGRNVADDSVIAVMANKSCIDLSSDFKNYLKLGKLVKVSILTDSVSEELVCYGSPALQLSDEEDIIIRKSDFIDGGTLAILANKGAHDLKRELIDKLKNRRTVVRIIFESE